MPEPLPLVSKHRFLFVRLAAGADFTYLYKGSWAKKLLTPAGELSAHSRP